MAAGELLEECEGLTEEQAEEEMLGEEDIDTVSVAEGEVLLLALAQAEEDRDTDMEPLKEGDGEPLDDCEGLPEVQAEEEMLGEEEDEREDVPEEQIVLLMLGETDALTDPELDTLRAALLLKLGECVTLTVEQMVGEPLGEEETDTVTVAEGEM